MNTYSALELLKSAHRIQVGSFGNTAGPASKAMAGAPMKGGQDLMTHGGTGATSLAAPKVPGAAAAMKPALPPTPKLPPALSKPAAPPMTPGVGPTPQVPPLPQAALVNRPQVQAMQAARPQTSATSPAASMTPPAPATPPAAAAPANMPTPQVPPMPSLNLDASMPGAGGSLAPRMGSDNWNPTATGSGMPGATMSPKPGDEYAGETLKQGSTTRGALDILQFIKAAGGIDAVMQKKAFGASLLRGMRGAGRYYNSAMEGLGRGASPLLQKFPRTLGRALGDAGSVAGAEGEFMLGDAPAMGQPGQIGRNIMNRVAYPLAGAGIGNGVAVGTNNAKANWQKQHPIQSWAAQTFAGMPQYHDRSYILPSFMQR